MRLVLVDGHEVPPGCSCNSKCIVNNVFINDIL